MGSTPPQTSKFAPYKQALAAISQRTRTPLPSLIVSFAILHELTAFVPLAGFFYSARAIGVGEQVVGAFAPRSGTDGATTGLASHIRDTWIGEKFREWMVQGEVRAERVGRRYGWFGFEKGSKPEGRPSVGDQSVLVTGKIAGDVANAVVAYALTKALLPVRIGISMYFAPSFSRAFIQPISSMFSRLFKPTA